MVEKQLKEKRNISDEEFYPGYNLKCFQRIMINIAGIAY